MSCYQRLASSHIESYVPHQKTLIIQWKLLILIAKVQLKSLHSVLSLHKGLVSVKLDH